MTQTLTIRMPDDWHLHLRDGAILQETVPASARCFKRAIVMPNLAPPVTTAEMAMAYRTRILEACPTHSSFEPLMTLYLTDQTSREDIIRARQAGVIAAKLYPAGATTNSDAAVRTLESLYPVFEAMSEQGMLLLVHGEVTHAEIDIFDREKAFIDEHLRHIIERFTDLKVVFEHITTADAARFVEEGPERLAATITPQHLLLNRNDLLVGGIRPHNYCLPVLKRNTHQLALQETVKRGSPRFFLGTDSAPHEKSKKENACGCAGCYSAWSAIELYAEIFDRLGILNQLENFASNFGADFYGLPRNNGSITLQKQDWQVPDEIDLPEQGTIVPFYAGERLSWKLSAVSSQ